MSFSLGSSGPRLGPRGAIELFGEGQESRAFDLAHPYRGIPKRNPRHDNRHDERNSGASSKRGRFEE